MILDIDIGNTRIKWILRDRDSQMVARGVDFNTLWSERCLPVRKEISRVRVSSVKGDFDAKITAYFRNKLGVIAEFAAVIDGVTGLKCGYKDTSKLGVDRWLALLACWQNICREAIVVGAGTALTVDVLSGHGHQGGFIIPGMVMMKRSLGVGTWGVKVDEEPAAFLSPADDTSGAVVNGCLVALVGVVEQVVRITGITRVVLAGGDSSLLQQHLARELQLTTVPDLVLDGLAVALP